MKKNFKGWFLKYNKNKQLGNVINVWPKQNVIGAECLKDLFVCLDDYLCLIKFVGGIDPLVKIFKVTKGNLRDYDTNEDISKGSKVTIKLPLDTKCEPNLQNAMIFLYSG